MIVLRGIVFFLLLMVGTFVSVAGTESQASTPMPTAANAIEAYDKITKTATDHCMSDAAAYRNGTSHDGCCRDMNCWNCTHPGIAPLTSSESATLPLDEHANATTIAPMVGRTIAPETGPPKSIA